ncbi:glycine cleavage system protein GcvH [Zooshikella marina]|uniref:Glycine cleavage system H protein n=1 Tax=Zooshikella ganghwensis TaxID=202772 RepID=A0A4P9VI60_9GAMM|nr:glycine cleavage system protein GcvH [Zooshikella ganghwensis]MBU2708239.1 glycine cleavage system protein GcvH [Zooshikella ganghwensis]RDH42054.1 glycine cleavage system protein GcvH [Zooshikella ganghwensis]
MSNIPAELRYVSTHEWVRLEDDNTAVVGITDHAQELLGDVVFIELPDVDATISAGDEVGTIESVKAASDMFAPLSGDVVAINEDLEEAPELVNSDPYGDGWLFKIKVKDQVEVDELLDADAYRELCEADE